MNHPLSGINSQLGAQLGDAQLGAASKKKKRPKRLARYRSHMGTYDFGMSFDGLGGTDFSNQEIVNDFAGIGGEDDEAFSGFGDEDEYLGKFSFKKGLKKIGGGIKKGAKKVGGGIKKVAYKAVGKKVPPPKAAATQSFSSVAAAVAAPRAMVAQAISAPVSHTARPAPAPAPAPVYVAPVNTSIPQVAAPISTSIPVMSTLATPAPSQGTVVSQGGISLNTSQLSAETKPVVVATKSTIAHPLAIYASPMASINGFEGFFDDLKKKIVGDVKTATKTAVTTAKSNLITNVTKTITGNDVVQKAAADVAAQNAAEAAIAKTQEAAKELVAKTQEAAQYVSENKGKVAGISTAVLAAGALGAYLMFFRKK